MTRPVPQHTEDLDQLIFTAQALLATMDLYEAYEVLLESASGLDAWVAVRAAQKALRDL
jgi:hypothetical protein